MKDALGHGSNAHNSGIENLPHKGVNDFRLFADNDSGLYHQSKLPIEKNLDKKMAKGVYDHEMSVKLWGYHADRAAQAYHKQSGGAGKWNAAFPPALRRSAARSWADDYRNERQGAKGHIA